MERNEIKTKLNSVSITGYPSVAHWNLAQHINYDTIHLGRYYRLYDNCGGIISMSHFTVASLIHLDTNTVPCRRRETTDTARLSHLGNFEEFQHSDEIFVLLHSAQSPPAAKPLHGMNDLRETFDKRTHAGSINWLHFYFSKVWANL